MPTVKETSLEVSGETKQELGGRTLVTGIALGSFSALLLELSLTRLFSVVLFYHFAFLAISIALLGLGAGGIAAHLSKRRLKLRSTRQVAASCSLLVALTIPVALEVALQVPVSLDLTGSNFLRLTLIYLSSALPFFLTGVAFSLIFAREPARIQRLYAADLAGGAMACLAVVPLLNRIGAPNVVLVAALASAVASALWSGSKRLRTSAVGLSVALVTLITLNFSGRLIDVVWAKGMRRTNVEFSRWNALSRVEVEQADQGAKNIRIDSDAGTYIMHADPAHWEGSAWQTNLMSAPAAVVNALRPRGDYAIIGPGGGVDVLRAVASGSPNVTGIEINPIIANTLMRGRYAEFSYHLYERPGVKLKVADGRSYIRQTAASFDVLEMTLVDTWAATAAGAFALSENNLYTTQAFGEYFTHLRADGILAITRWEFEQPREALRVVSVAMRALRGLGIRDASRHFVVVSYGPLDEDGVPVAILAKKSEFTREEEEIVAAHLGRYPPLELLYSPSIPASNAFSALIRTNDPEAFSSGYSYNVSPVSDDSPFFFFTVKPSGMWRLWEQAGAIDWKVNLGVTVLGMLVVVSVLAVLAFLILPLFLDAPSRAGVEPRTLLYFVALGLGYILVEVTFIQRFVLFLGHPSYALTVVVFLMLVGSGIGSALSNRIFVAGRLWMPLAATLVVLTGLVWGLGPILERLVGLPFAAKLVTSALMLFPLGLVMGMPFPVGLRMLAEKASEAGNSIEWAWAMNAAASVLGSVLAMVIAVEFGLNVTLAAAGAAYLAAFVLRGRLART